MDSIYERYSFGALLFWRSNEKLMVERKLGPILFPPHGNIIAWIKSCDGQQGRTPIFGVSKPQPVFPNDSAT